MTMKLNFFLSLFFLQVSLTASDLRIFFTSSLNGYIKDCLCKAVPAPGLSKRHTLLQSLSFDRYKDILLETGDILDKGFIKPNKAFAIYESYTEIGYHLITPGLHELKFRTQDLFKQPFSSYPLHSANIRIPNYFLSKPIGKEFVLLKRNKKVIGLLPLSSPKLLKRKLGKKYDSLKISEVEESILQVVENNKADLWILVYYGTLKEASTLIDKLGNKFIMIVGSEKKKPSKGFYSLSLQKKPLYHLPGEGEYLGVLKFDSKSLRFKSGEILQPDFDKTEHSSLVLKIMEKHSVKD